MKKEWLYYNDVCINMQGITKNMKKYSILTILTCFGYNNSIIKRSALAGEYPVSADILV